MEKAKVFIASSGRTLTLAAKLRDALQTDVCEARVWSEEGRCQPGVMITEMLESAAEEVDFAVIILVKDDVMVKEGGDTLKARDNCVFEAGLFRGTIGQKRCFLVTSVKESDLPSDLCGIISIPFEEPADLTDRIACAKAIAPVAADLKGRVQSEGRSAFHERVPLLSVEELFQRERPQAEGGDLREGKVVVCDTQPMAGVEPALRVRHNIDSGTGYNVFLYLADDTIDKVCQFLQVMLMAGVGDSGKATDFTARVSTIKEKKDRVLVDLRSICRSRSLQMTLLMDEPQFSFRVHNASDPVLARLYARYGERGFLLWAEGPRAVALWRMLPKFLADDKTDRLFIPMKNFCLEGDKKELFESSFRRALSRYFPGIENEIWQICVGGA